VSLGFTSGGVGSGFSGSLGCDSGILGGVSFLVG
jgi:uncharacterized protein YjbI with pentapeptide repeats